jgi:uncharacterized membrane protein
MTVRSYLRSLAAHRRVLLSIAFAIAIWGVLTQVEIPGPTRTILALDLGGLLFLALAWRMMVNSTPERMRLRARLQDEGRLTVMGLTVGAAVFGLAAITVELHGLKDLSAQEQLFHLGLAAASIVISWLVTHSLFALHYAHGYYGDGGHAEGLTFPECDQPDYWDFLYFSFVIAMTAQTSDTAITSRAMRRLALGHSVLSFFFNTVILALSVNIAAGML